MIDMERKAPAPELKYQAMAWLTTVGFQVIDISHEFSEPQCKVGMFVVLERDTKKTVGLMHGEALCELALTNGWKR